MLKPKSKFTHASRFKSSSLLSLNEIDALGKSFDWRNSYIVKPKEIGRGHFSKVFLVTSVSEDKPFAAKVIRRRKYGIDRVDKIRKEAEIIKRLNEKNVISIIHLLETFESFSEIVLICELAKGGSLFNLIQEFTTGLNENYAKCVIYKLLQALESMHSDNIVHLDIKADNILLREPYPSTNIALCDFGLATELKKEKSHKELVGTPDYMAPEVVSYEKISVNTDMWSVGVLTYYLLTGNSPFMGASKDETLINVSKARIFYDPVFEQNHMLKSKGFIFSLCVKSPNLRLSSTDAQTHTWFENIHDLNLDYPLESPQYSSVINFDNDSAFDRDLINYKSLPLKNSRRSQSFHCDPLVYNFQPNDLQNSVILESSDHIFSENVQSLNTDCGNYNNNNQTNQGSVIPKLLSSVNETPDELQYDIHRHDTFKEATIIDKYKPSECGNNNNKDLKHSNNKTDELLSDYDNAKIDENTLNRLPMKEFDEESSINVLEMSIQSSSSYCHETSSQGVKIFDRRQSQNPANLFNIETKSDTFVTDSESEKSNKILGENNSDNFDNLTDNSANIKEAVDFKASDLDKLKDQSNLFKCDTDNFESGIKVHEIMLGDQISPPSNMGLQEMLTQNKNSMDTSIFSYHSIGQNKLNYDDQNSILMSADSLHHLGSEKAIDENEVTQKPIFQVPQIDSHLPQCIERSNDLDNHSILNKSEPINSQTEVKCTTLNSNIDEKDLIDFNECFKQREENQEMSTITKQLTDDYDLPEAFEEPVLKPQRITAISESDKLVDTTNRQVNYYDPWLPEVNELGIIGYSSKIDSFKTEELTKYETDNAVVDDSNKKPIDQHHSVYRLIEMDNENHNLQSPNVDDKIESVDLEDDSGVNLDFSSEKEVPIYLDKQNDPLPNIVGNNHVDNLHSKSYPKDISIIDTTDKTLNKNIYTTITYRNNSLKTVQPITKSPILSRNFFGLNLNTPIFSHLRGKPKSKYKARNSLEPSCDNDQYFFKRDNVSKSDSDDPFSEPNLLLNLDEYENISNTGLEKNSSLPISLPISIPIQPRTSSTTSSGTQKSASDEESEDKDLTYTAFLELCIIL